MDTEKMDKAEKPKSQVDECAQMTQVRSYLDKTVDVLAKKLEGNQFCEAMPSELDKKFVSSLHNKFCSIMRTKMGKIVDQRLTEYDLAQKLNELDEITKNTPNSTSHRAWRPPRGDTVAGCVQAHDLQVLQEQKTKLTALVESASEETNDLEVELQEVIRRMQENQAVLQNMSSEYKNFISSIHTIIEMDTASRETN